MEVIFKDIVINVNKLKLAKARKVNFVKDLTPKNYKEYKEGIKKDILLILGVLDLSIKYLPIIIEMNMRTIKSLFNNKNSNSSYKTVSKLNCFIERALETFLSENSSIESEEFEFESLLHQQFICML